MQTGHCIASMITSSDLEHTNLTCALKLTCTRHQVQHKPASIRLQQRLKAPALECRCEAPSQDATRPQVQAYLQEPDRHSFDIHLSVEITPSGSTTPTVVTHSNFKHLCACPVTVAGMLCLAPSTWTGSDPCMACGSW